MATWQYSDYITLRGRRRLKRVALFIQEVTDALAGLESATFDGDGWKRRDYEALLARLDTEYNRLRAALGVTDAEVGYTGDIRLSGMMD